MMSYLPPSVIPVPCSTVPLAESIGGSVGALPTFLRGDMRIPRISRAMTVVTLADGTFSGTWTTALGVSPVIFLTPIAGVSVPLVCQLTATPTTTNFQGRVWQQESAALGLGLTGSTLAPVGAGISIQVIAIPPTQ